SLSALFCWLPDTKSSPHLRTGTELPGVLVVTPAVAQPMTTRRSGAVTMRAVGVSDANPARVSEHCADAIGGLVHSAPSAFGAGETRTQITHSLTTQHSTDRVS